MADLAFHQGADFSFDNSGNFTSPAFDTTSDTWAVLYICNISNSLSGITAISYNGVSILSNLVVNTATPHISANAFGIVYIGLGANAGNHTFNIQWTGGGFLVFSAISGSGDLDAGVIDGAPQVDATETISAGSTVTPPTYTPTTNKALPVIAIYNPSQIGAVTANANCTLGAVLSGDPFGTFYCPLSTPAGTATSAVINYSGFEFFQFISFAFKPSGGAGTVVGSNFYRQVAGLGA